MSLRSANSHRLALLALIAILSVGGYVATRRIIQSDRKAESARRVQIESLRAQSALGDARAYVAGLANLLEGEAGRGQRQFARLAGGAAGSVGLIDALWVQRISDAERRAYERGQGFPVTRLEGTRFVAAPTARTYLPATFTTRTRAELRRGVDVSPWHGLAGAIEDRARVFAVGASLPASLGRQPGLYLLQAADFGRDRDRRGFLAVFVPRGWLTASLDQDPRTVAINLDGRRLEGRLEGQRAATSRFALLGRTWSIDVGNAPPTALQRALPWLALLWPLAVAVLVFLVGRVVLGRRRAERDFELTFNLSRDLMCIAGVDGYYKRVNPAFGDALGYPPGELLSSPMDRFVHPDDHERMHEAIGRLSRGEEVAQFESRAVRADGAVRWLEWSARSVAAEGLIYAVARDVTDRRQTERELELLAREQAALRRVATLVARDASPADVLDAVVAEVRALLGSDATRLLRYDDDDTCVVVANNSDPGTEIPVGTRVPLEGDNIPGLIRRSRKTLRQHGLEGAAGPLAARARSMGVEVAAGAPVSVEGRLWGVMVAIWTRRVPLGIETEGRMEQFTDLVAVAIANAESRTQLVASRARVVTAADETRRRIERDLHDATQQRLVSLALELRATEASIPESMPEIRSQLAETASGLGEVLDEVQEISRGIHPVILSTSGLGPALRTLARRSAVPVELDVHLDGRLPLPVEVASYHVVSEALTNAAKHASATVVHVGVQSHDSIVDLEVRDDGVGGASPARGSGLVGLRDRVEALAGTIDIESAPGHGTALSVRIPIVDDLS